MEVSHKSEARALVVNESRMIGIGHEHREEGIRIKPIHLAMYVLDGG